MPADTLEAMNAIAMNRASSLGLYRNAYSNRMNSAGEAFEYYAKDAISGDFYKSNDSREKAYRTAYSWLGNQNNPPDAIAAGGDAFEVKKLQSPRNTIALNSSPPKDMLYSDDIRIASGCRNSDGGSWQKKDLFYIVGWINGTEIRSIYFVQGTCYAASRDVYSRISSRLSSSVKGAIEASGLESGKTDELGRINRVDPLGITSLRVRGMWQIDNPSRVFQDIAPLDQSRLFQAYAIMEWGKYQQMLAARNMDTLPEDSPIKARKEKIKDPNNPANAIDAAVLEVWWK